MTRTLGVLAASTALLLAACAHAPKSAGARSELQYQARQTVAQMIQQDPGLQPLIDHSAGYIVFPEVKQGGFIVGGAGGQGVLFERGRVTGYASLSQGSVGAVAGGQKFSELIVLQDQQALDRARAGNFKMGAQASAVIVRTGAATATRFENGVAVFVAPKVGAMVNASLMGQNIKITM
jgi:lipid-binding SYLF domain-containing protein